MKNIFMLVSLFLFSLLTGDNTFVGGNYINSNFSMNILSQKSSEIKPFSFDGSGLIVKVGKVNKKRRFYIDFGNHWKKDELSYLHMFSINYDKFFEVQSDFIPFIGGGIGYGKMKNTRRTTDLEAGIDYSIRAGVMFNINKKSSLEFQYGYMIPSVPDDSRSLYRSTVIKGVYIGYNYTF